MEKFEYDKNYFYENIIAVGDIVEAKLTNKVERQEVEAYVLSIKKRRNIFCRAVYKRMQIIASNIDKICIVSSLDQPLFRHGFIDRVLVAASHSSIPVCIILNKYDLIKKNKSMHDKVIQQIKHYKSININTLKESFQNKVSNSFKTMIHNHRTLLVGLSGVGKSTLINQILGESRQTINKIGSNNKGRHTTTNSKLYNIGGAELIDAPGIKEFGLQHLAVTQIKSYFPEFSNSQCRFENCLHICEPDCGVLSMLANKSRDLPKWRYQSYLHITQSIHEKYKYRRGDYRN